MEQVSVEAGLRRGSILLKVVPVVILCSGIAGGMTTMTYRMDLHPGLRLLFGFLVGSIASWLWWSFAVTRWRIWAFTHVRNINELMELAVKDKLIWREGSWFARTEIRTRGQREMLQLLKGRMEIPDEVQDDPTVPVRTVIHYSVIQYILLLALGLPLFGFGLYMCIQSEEGIPWSALLVVAVGAWLSFDATRKLRDRNARVIISSEGIALAEKGTFTWDKIRNEEVTTIGSGKSTLTVLKFRDTSTGVQELDIADLKTSKPKLRHALKIHRYRWAQGRQSAKGSA